MMQRKQKVEATFITVTGFVPCVIGWTNHVTYQQSSVTGLWRARARITVLLARSASPDECFGKDNQSLHKIPKERMCTHHVSKLSQSPLKPHHMFTTQHKAGPRRFAEGQE